MQSSRRAFLARGARTGGVLSLLSIFAAGGGRSSADEAGDDSPTQQPSPSPLRSESVANEVAGHEADRPAGGVSLVPLDYGRSFIGNTSPANSVRFWIESRTLLYPEPNSEPHEFLQCGSCKSENTFGERDLFYENNYDFLPIFGGEDLLIFRRTASLNPGYRQLRKAVDAWGQPVLQLRRAPRTRELAHDDWDAIRRVTEAGLPLVGQTELVHAESGRRAVIEYPIKTMNISHPKRMFQVDTGPIALCDLTRPYDPPIDSVRLAYVAFNAPDFADFVIEQPTPLVPDDPASPRVHHYSRPVSYPARNRLFALEVDV